ncbi:MAG TPA: 3-dehydroquinate synthase, partial [Coriobacteriia bacterium]|nr:3-dehydroquinate synthase [Coriobacteriia bacterium]
GVDLRAGKNLAGVFKQPLLVIADTASLTSVPDTEWRSGLAEVAKVAILSGHDQAAWTLANANALVAREAEAVRTAVLHAVSFKADVVAADERESSTREVLNYGHTLGHAIECVAGYGAVPHGVAVAEGMRFAARLAERLEGTRLPVTELQDRLLLALGIERPSYPGDVAALLGAMHADKKARAGTVRFVLVPEPGVWRVEPVGDAALAAALSAWVESDEEGG